MTGYYIDIAGYCFKHLYRDSWIPHDSLKSEI